MPGDPVGAWMATLAAAMLGSERAGGAPAYPTGFPALEAAADAAMTLLTGLAALTPFRQAGFALAPAILAPFPPFETAGFDCGPAAANRLATILAPDRQQIDHLPEWCVLARSAGVDVPPELLAYLASLRTSAPVEAVLGPRAAWLGSVTGAPPPARALDPSAWTEGDAAQRLLTFRAWRDSDPDAARDALSGAWTIEALDLRLHLLDACSSRLDAGDEPFLEELLDDRSKQVRAKAAGLLTALPASRRAARLEARARNAVRLTPAALAIKLPDDDPALARDGIASATRSTQAPAAAAGRQTRLLAAILEATPPRAFADHPPATWIAAACASDWAEILIGSWTIMAVRLQDTAWQNALFTSLCPLRTGSDTPAPWITRAFATIFCAKSPQDKEAFVSKTLRSPENAFACDLLDLCRFPWSIPFTSDVLAWLGRDVQRPDLPRPDVSDTVTGRQVSKDLGMLAHPACWPQASALRDALEANVTPDAVMPARSTRVAQIADCLRFRFDMQQEFAPP